jgi:small subunit ribosomal protein S20
VPNLADARKRVKQNERRRARNRNRTSALKSETRKLTDKLSAGDVAGAKAQYIKVTKKLDKIAAKGTLHKNTAARRKSRLAKRLNALAAGKK